MSSKIGRRRRYWLSPEAQQDLLDIRAYYVQQADAKVARYVLGEIARGFRFLANTPGAGHHREDLTDQAVRFWPVFSYLVVYDPAMKPLGIARILHGNRDLEELFRRTPPHA